jgi:hypothetical protein
MAAEHGIPVAPLREVKETIEQYESPSMSAMARERANQAATEAFAATKALVHFASPHVQSASRKAVRAGKKAAAVAAKVARERLEDVRTKHRTGDLRVPTIDEAKDAVTDASRKVLGVAIHAYDRVAERFTSKETSPLAVTPTGKNKK